MNDTDRIVEDYLRRLRKACRALPRQARNDLLSEVRAHIAEAGAAGETGDEASVRNLLERLGDPADVAAAGGAPAAGTDRVGGMEIATVILLLIGGVVIVGWVAGVVLLWASPRWRWGDKLAGTLVWPGGLLGAVVVLGFASLSAVSQTGCSSPVETNVGSAPGQPVTLVCQPISSGPPTWLVIALVVVILLAPFGMAIWLLHRARAAARFAS
jgi:hypothetical protein